MKTQQAKYNTVKPIETSYNGYKFRSRLEARWAVFFDELQIKYEYELEGFTLPSGEHYLPDFYLPQFEVFVEVKPFENIPKPDLIKLFEFAFYRQETTYHPLLLIVGTPTNEDMYLLNPHNWPDLDLLHESEDEVFEECRKEIFNGLRDWHCVCFGLTPLHEWNHGGEYPFVDLVYKSLPPTSDMYVNKALIKAKQARFEHKNKKEVNHG